MGEYGEQKRSQNVILFAKCHRVAKASMMFALVQELASKKPKDEAWANLNQGASVMREGDGGMSHQIFSKHVFVRQFTPYQKVDHFHTIWEYHFGNRHFVST